MPQDKPSYSLWYCPAYPVEKIQFSTRTAFDNQDEARPFLLKDIEKRGLVNPLIILNHRSDSYKRRYVMTGNNRLWAVKTLGWEVVPAIVTGDPDLPIEYVPVPWEKINSYFKDGEIYLGSHGPRIRGFSDFTKGELPK